jgi:hypothetical protein
MDLVSNVLIAVQTGTLFVALGTLIVGLRSYREGQKLKRKEILFSMTEELDKSETMEYARSILDDRVVRFNRWKKSIDTYNISWEDIQGDYRPLKDLLRDELGLDWIEDHHFRKIDEKDVVVLTDQDSFLSIVPNQKLPYCVEEKTLNRMIMLENNNKSEYKHVYCFYANIVHLKVIELGYYYHKSNLKHILRKHSESPIMDGGEDEIRRSFNYVFRFLERLGYIDKNLGLTNEELGFFKAFVNKLNVEGVVDYIEHYKFNLERLHPKLSV